MNILCSSSIANSTSIGPVNQTKVNQAVAKAISPARFAPYLATCSNHHKRALDLYWWNVRMSREIYAALHLFEVFLRNAMDEQLCLWNSSNSDNGVKRSSEWLRDPHSIIENRVGDKILKATDHAKMAIFEKTGENRNPSHDEVLAQTPFGLWAILLPTENDKGKAKIWDEGLIKAFPSSTTSLDRRYVIQQVKRVHTLRNRVAHLEPIYSLDVPQELGRMQKVLDSIDPKAAGWFTSKELGKQCWADKPAIPEG